MEFLRGLETSHWFSLYAVAGLKYHRRLRVAFHQERREAFSFPPSLLSNVTPQKQLNQGYESTHPPEPSLNALLHNDCTGKVPVDKLMPAEAPCPEEIQAHLSPFSSPLESSQPPFGN